MFWLSVPVPIPRLAMSWVLDPRLLKSEFCYRVRFWDQDLTQRSCCLGFRDERTGNLWNCGWMVWVWRTVHYFLLCFRSRLLPCIRVDTHTHSIRFVWGDIWRLRFWVLLPQCPAGTQQVGSEPLYLLKLFFAYLQYFWLGTMAVWLGKPWTYIGKNHKHWAPRKFKAAPVLLVLVSCWLEQ